MWVWLPQLCVEEKMVLLADEVYQSNIYVDDRKFISFRKVRTHHISLPPQTSHCTESGGAASLSHHSFP